MMGSHGAEETEGAPEELQDLNVSRQGSPPVSPGLSGLCFLGASRPTGVSGSPDAILQVLVAGC